jgi:ATP-dependent exoDNAse (exonuclease V) alpha subunit
MAEQFLYAGEHVTHGTAITALQSVRNALERTKAVLPGGPWNRYVDWIDGELSALWKMHGLAPGLGSALCCVGGKLNGTLFAHALAAELQDDDEPWPVVEAIFTGEREPPAGAPELKRMQRARFQDLRENDPKAYELIKLLSRFELTRDEAKSVFESEAPIDDFLRNPYRLFETTRNSALPIGLTTIDRSLYPQEAQEKRPAFPTNMEVDLDEPEDPLRLRALVVDALERASAQGNTVLGIEQLVRELENSPLSKEVDVDEQVIRLCKDAFAGEIRVWKEDGEWLVQLNRYCDAGEIIREHVRARIGEGQDSSIDWPSLIAEQFGAFDASNTDEQAAREEKRHALEALERSRLTILTGPAGTGKTTLLKIFLDQASLVGGDILLLAPTGKARVRLGNQTQRPMQARTLAQFLLEHDRYNFETGEHYFDRGGETAAVSTCVVDECSMLTEDQLAALLSAVPISARLVLVGDPQQLPPIGAGRPFVDIIKELRTNHDGSGLAELRVSRRQGSSGSLISASSLPDVQLASMFSGRPLAPGEDEVVAAGETPADTERLRFVTWDAPSDLRETLLEVLEKELGRAGASLERCVDLSLGAVESGDFLYFNEGAGESAESWQILSAHRNTATGSAELNRFLKSTVRTDRLAAAQKRTGRWRVIKPRGNDLITYGDKVICLRNHKRKRYSRDEGARPGYLANGEVGMIVGDASTNHAPRWTKVEFASQAGEVFSFNDFDFSEEGNPFLELAYAVTVHKAQGSEFGSVILILPANSRLLSREMLYTALTRQKNRVWVLHQGPFQHYLKLGSDFFSETARRSTNLFGAPKMSLISELGSGGKRSAWLAEHLIHKTERGDLVRSKSEVIIANALEQFEKAKQLRYSYEKPLTVADGSYRLPDFTIETEDGTWYWEHCGMLGLPEYSRRWEVKLHWYEEHGIAPRTEANPTGRLIVTEDALNGGIDSSAIHELASSVFG